MFNDIVFIPSVVHESTAVDLFSSLKIEFKCTVRYIYINDYTYK